MKTSEKRFEEARNSILKCDAKKAEETAKQALAEDFDPVELLNSGFIPGINEVGDLFGKGRMFLPELIMAAAAMEKVIVVINAALVEKGAEAGIKKGKILIGTVEGDMHDIGKTIVLSLFKANGFDVLDAGRDVPCDRIIEQAESFGADIIGTSALLTTTMEKQRKLEEELKTRGLRDKYKTIVGGAPVTQRWADRIGADAYAEDAADGIIKAKELLGLR